MNPFQLLGQLQNIGKMQEEMELAAKELAKVDFTGSAGGGMVVARVNGAQKLLACTIDPKLIADNDLELMEDLIIAAVNDAMDQARRKSAEMMQQKMMQTFNIPGLEGILGKLLQKP